MAYFITAEIIFHVCPLMPELPWRKFPSGSRNCAPFPRSYVQGLAPCSVRQLAEPDFVKTAGSEVTYNPTAVATVIERFDSVEKSQLWRLRQL